MQYKYLYRVLKYPTAVDIQSIFFFFISGIVIIFVISWVPLGSFVLLTDIYTSMSSQSVLTCLAVSHVIAMTSAISNPIVYGWLNSNMRHEFLQLLPRSCAARCSARDDKDDEANVGATAVENDTTRTHIHYHCVDNDINSKKESYLLVSLNKNLNNNPNSQNFAHL